MYDENTFCFTESLTMLQLQMMLLQNNFIPESNQLLV